MAEDLGVKFEKIEHAIMGGSYIDKGTNPVLATALLGQAIVKLDKSSTRLAWINIGLAIVVVLIGGIQICLMLSGAH